MNLNRLFPRLTIRAKLAIAFVVLAGIPLVLVAGLATRAKVDHLRTLAMISVAHDVDVARAQVERALQDAEENVAYLARALSAPVLADATPERLAAAGRSIAEFLQYKPSLYQLKLIGADGTLLLTAEASLTGDAAQPNEDGEAQGMYYAYRAQSLEPGGQLLLPVELRSTGAKAGAATIPAVAILMPVWDAGGRFQGAVVGEVYAAVLFSGLEVGSPHLVGVTGLVDQEGFFLYHSERKRDWANLLATRAELDLRSDIPLDLTAEVGAGAIGTVTAGHRIVTYSQVSLGNYGTGPLLLYRAVPLAVLEGPVQTFMRRVGAAGLLLGGVVLVLAVVAANQFTRPIYRLREAVHGLAAGESPDPLAIATNDELEDLATDFSAMASSLSSYRHRLEELVAERTRALHETYAELANVLAHSADAIIGLDPVGRVRIWNRGAEALFGYRSDEAVARNLDTLLRPAGPRAVHEAEFLKRELAASGAVVNFQTQRAHKDGRRLPVSLTHSVIVDEAGASLGYSVIMRDTSMQATLEEQMRRSERLAAVSIMATTLAHEVNNPLAIISTRIECMERDVRSKCPDCDLERDLAVLREHTVRLSELTRDLLQFAAADEESTGPVALDALAARVARLAEPTIAARHLRLEVRTDGEALPCIKGNENALETVCLNLLLNAADATPPGGTVSIVTRVGGDGGEVELEVRDTGSGVPRELRRRIFEPFFTTKGARGGTGLGLAVCRTVVERHGGRIRLESEEGRGSRFIVVFPRVAARHA